MTINNIFQNRISPLGKNQLGKFLSDAVSAACLQSGKKAVKLLKVAQNSFQHLYWMGRYNHSLSLDATTMVSKNFSIIGKHVAIIFLTH